MTKLTLILMAAVPAMLGASAVAKPATERLAAVSASTAPVTNAESARLLRGLTPGDEIAPRLKKIKASIQALQSPLATKRLQMASLSRGHDETIALDQALVKLRTGFDAVEQRTRSIGGRASVDASRSAIDALRSRLDAAKKDLESKDKLGNFEIQPLMSSYNRAQTAASNVEKKLDEAKSGIKQNLQ
jgi:hypothetical protein